MKTRNLLFTLLTMLSLCWANVGLADDVAAMPSPSEMTVNVNEADAETLADVLNGVGVTRAEAIIEYREAHGKFYSPEELTAVRGIGETTVAKNEGRIRVE